MTKGTILSVIVIIFCSILSGCNPFKNQTFEDCLLENLKGVKSDDAASDIRMACAVKTAGNNKGNSYEGKKCESRELTIDEKKLVSGRANVESHEWMKVTLHNGNKDLKINGIKVKLIDKINNQEFLFDLSHYKVAPLETSDKMLTKLLYVPKKWDWDIYSLTTEICK